MSTYEIAYSNTTTDLISVLPSLEKYDQKKLITDWTVYTDYVYQSSSGYVSMLYQNGKELGKAEDVLEDVDATDEWYYDSSADMVYFYNSSNSPNEDRMEAGVDWETLKIRVNNEQAERLRSYISRPILPRKGVGTESASDREWDWIVVRSNALLTVSELVRPHDQELAEYLEKKVIDPENEYGLLDRLKKGDYKLWNETAHNKIKGLREVSIDASTTGAIIDVKGTPLQTDILKIQIQNGDTLVAGSSSAVTYSVWGGDSSGIKVSQLVEDDIVTGGWDIVGRGVMIRFSAGVYVANDEWELELMGSESEDIPKIKTVQARRC